MVSECEIFGDIEYWSDVKVILVQRMPLVARITKYREIEVILWNSKSVVVGRDCVAPAGIIRRGSDGMGVVAGIENWYLAQC